MTEARPHQTFIIIPSDTSHLREAAAQVAIALELLVSCCCSFTLMQFPYRYKTLNALWRHLLWGIPSGINK